MDGKVKSGLAAVRDANGHTPGEVEEMREDGRLESGQMLSANLADQMAQFLRNPSASAWSGMTRAMHQYQAKIKGNGH